MINLGTADCPVAIVGYAYDDTISTATAFATPPEAATAVLVQAEGQAIRITTDGTTPTSTVGLLVPVASEGVLVTGDHAKLQVIETALSAKVSLTYLSY